MDRATQDPDAEIQSSALKRVPTSRPLDVIVIGGGQAGLSVGYHLQRSGLSFLILDAAARVGDSWRERWDSLRLFTPAWLDGLDGMPFPLNPDEFPSKDQMADYLEAYAERFALPLRSGARVRSVRREGGRYCVATQRERFECHNVVVAMSGYQRPRIPGFARELNASVRQIHSSRYTNPSVLQEGPVLVAGAGNSGADLALELARSGRKVWLSGRDTGEVPFRIDGFWARLILVRLVLRFVFHHVLTVNNPLGRKARRRLAQRGGALIRVKHRDLREAGVECVPRIVGVRDGAALLADGRVITAPNLLWCSGYEPGFDFIELPILDERGEPRHERGVVSSAPGLFFVGLHFLFAMSSVMIHGVGRDAARVASLISASRFPSPPREPARFLSGGARCAAESCAVDAR